MRREWSLLVAATTLVACTTATSSAPSPSISPKIDACVVGRWVVTAQSFTDTSSVPGVTLLGTGGQGEVDTFTADGQETDNYSNASPYVVSGTGHLYTYTGRGIAHYTLQAKGGTWAESGPDQTISVTNYIVDGVQQPDGTLTAPPASGTYTCSGSSLMWVKTAPYIGSVVEQRTQG